MPQSVRRAARILDLFSPERPGWGPTAVARELGVTKSSAHALLAELAAAGLLVREDGGRYRLGWRLAGLARTASLTRGLPPDAERMATRLAAHAGETVHLGALDRDDVLYLTTRRPPGGVPAPGGTVPAAATPLGRVLLAERAGTLDAGERARIRRDGYAAGDHGRLPGVACVAAPVGPGAASLALCAPAERMRERRERYTRAVAGAAARLRRVRP